ncbi:hypothetical protein [Psychrobacter vallis]|uniref:hypothetical protein n=1 Tax=Psychrobacter vallis TaxID=248451 RepID=UPI001918FAF2|nr:hypothetical protein [Psychrobacter vallis]
MIEPFANNHQSMQIGELVIENQEDKIIIYGDMELTLDASGYQQAHQLHKLTTEIMQAFQTRDFSRDIPHNLYSNNEVKSKENDDQSGKNIDNPFL